jgi:hypothetical protein
MLSCEESPNPYQARAVNRQKASERKCFIPLNVRRAGTPSWFLNGSSAVESG